MLFVYVEFPCSIISFVRESGWCGRKKEPTESPTTATNAECETIRQESRKGVDEIEIYKRTSSNTRKLDLNAAIISNERDARHEFCSFPLLGSTN